ncbi:hypothetical protein E2C06_12485 [Dankookia rubra]|uniref:DUF4136 domain-containing protein n=1 Tax=Dankookia rubra TaxID=1442381 RepID=A0A4R5QFZ8_9PROT|nr:hypothetical protein [Dankookia rubra]TDH62202.1 hypothetical protein E2C06_12485 [Dankookia rubra]
MPDPMRTMSLALLLAALLPAGQALAQAACPGHLSATALAPVPREAVYGIALRNDDATGRALRDRVFAALRAAGHRVGEPATHVLSWRGSLSADGGRGGGADPFSFRDADNNRDGDDLGWMRDVPRNRRGGAAPVRRLNGNVELRERASGRVVWTAVLSCDRQGDDQAALIGTLVGAVVPVIGQTVAGRAF